MKNKNLNEGNKNPLEVYRDDEGRIDPRIEFESPNRLLSNLLTSDKDMQAKIADILSEKLLGYNPLK
jgi:hypothetical protein